MGTKKTTNSSRSQVICDKCKKEFYYGNYFPDTKEYICESCWMSEDTPQKPPK